MQMLICVRLLCGQDTVFEKPLRVLSEAQVEDMGLSTTILVYTEQPLYCHSLQRR